MSGKLNFDAAVLGGGASGTCLCWYLMKAGMRVALVNKQSDETTSTLKAALINPVSAKQLNLNWEAEKSLDEFIRLIKESNADECMLNQNGILRPITDQHLYDSVQNNLKGHTWPDNWFSKVGKEDLKNRIPELCQNYGGLEILVGSTLKPAPFLAHLQQQLVSNGMRIFESNDYRIEKQKNSAVIYLEDDQKIRCDRLVFATGSHLTQSPLWSSLPIYKIKGQTAEFTVSEPITWKQPIIGDGYIIPLNPTTLMLGGTHGLHFNDAEPDQQASTKLYEKFQTMLPELAEHAQLKSQWAGIGVTTPNRLPFIGDHPRNKCYYIFGGLGPKGLLLAPYTAKLAAGNIANKYPLPDELNAERHWSKLRRLGKI